MTHRKFTMVSACLAVLAVNGVARSEVRLSSVISDNAVLQRDVQVPIWGLADPGEKVSVTFAGRTKAAAADEFGRWRVELDPMPASAQGRKLIVEGPDRAIEIENVVVGDVWLYLVMAFHLKDKSPFRQWEPDPSSLPPIRFFRASDIFEMRTHSRRPRAEFGSSDRGRWTEYKPPGKYFAHEAYYLGLGLGRETGVPVGVMGLGASTLESMTPPEGFEYYPSELAETAKQVATWTPAMPEGKRAYLKSIGQIKGWVTGARSTLKRGDVTFEDLSQPPLLPGPPAFERAETTHYNEVIHRYMPAAVRGLIIETHENNVGDPFYAAKAEALIKGLREVIGRNDLPVCVLQMHSPDRYEGNASETADDWAKMRQSQTGLIKGDPSVSVVASYDIGPTEREAMGMDLAMRVSQWAVALVRGTEIKTGPTYKSHRIEDGKVVVEFDHVGRGLSVGVKEPAKPVRLAPASASAVPPLGGFELAGRDGQWRDATAAIKGDAVTVTCDEIDRPVAVRYAAWPQPTKANLYNRNGFPALPFTSPQGRR